MGRHGGLEPDRGCTCAHIDGVWASRTQDPCPMHPCSLCLMRAGDHMGHVYIGAPRRHLTPLVFWQLEQLEYGYGGEIRSEREVR